MKTFHNTAVGKVIVIGFVVAIHGLFAAGAYYLGLFLASIIFKDVVWLQQGFAIGYAIMVFAGAMWAFVYSEYAHEDIVAYGRATGHPNYKWFLYIVMAAVGGSELASVLFRAYSTSDMAGRYVTITIGVLALVIAFCLGKVIHAMANRPFETAILRARENAGRSIVDDAASYVDKMTVDEKKRFYAGDMGAIGDVVQREKTAREEKLRVKSEKEQEQERKAEEKRNRRETKELTKQQRTHREQQSQQTGKAYTSKLLGEDQSVLDYPDFPNAQSNRQANHLSQSQQNGHRSNVSQN